MEKFFSQVIAGIAINQNRSNDQRIDQPIALKALGIAARVSVACNQRCDDALFTKRMKRFAKMMNTCSVCNDCRSGKDLTDFLRALVACE